MKQEDVADLTLEQMLGNDEEGTSIFRCTKSLVGTFLFTRYEKRRDFAKWALQRIWGIPVEIRTVQDSNTLYAYIELNNCGRYALVARYSSKSPIIEGLPSEAELRLWPK